MHELSIYQKLISSFLQKILMEKAISSKLISVRRIVTQKIKLFFQSFFSNSEQIVSCLRVFSHLPKRHFFKMNFFFSPIILFEIKLERNISSWTLSVHKVYLHL